MADAGPSAITTIQLSLDSDPIEGTLGEHGVGREFSGYAELAAAIEAWRREARESQPAVTPPAAGSSAAA